MTIQEQVSVNIKKAMLAKDQSALRGLRAIKSAFLLATSEPGATEELSDEAALKIIQKLVKQRRDSRQIFVEQGRADLAEKEAEEIEVLETFLPKQLDEIALKAIVVQSIEQLGAVSMKDMGRVMGDVSKKVQGQADNATISSLVKEILGA